jgi:hypothetical protein
VVSAFGCTTPPLTLFRLIIPFKAASWSQKKVDQSLAMDPGEGGKVNAVGNRSPRGSHAVRLNPPGYGSQESKMSDICSCKYAQMLTYLLAKHAYLHACLHTCTCTLGYMYACLGECMRFLRGTILL